MKTQRIILIGVASLAVLYFAAPIIAGATSTGDREGPVLYAREFHTALYIIGHEAAFQEKPRERFDFWMYRRPWFYGMARRLKSQSERDAYIEMAKRNQNPRIDRLIEMNAKANQASEVTARKLAEPQR